MQSAEILKNISLIIHYFKAEELSEEDKKNRKELSLSITNNIKDILYELYYEGFLLGTTETWGYKKNILTINFKKINYDIFFTIEINIDKKTLTISLRTENKFLYFDDVSLKITKKAIDKSSIKIKDSDWDNITFLSKKIKINSDDFEVTFLKEAKKILSFAEEKEFQFKEFCKTINKKDVFMFNAEGKALVSWSELNNYQATSKNVKNTTQNLLEYFFESKIDNEKNELKLVIAHLNLSVGYKFLNVIRMSDTSDEEKILMFEEMIKRVLATIDNQKLDGEASLSTRLYSNMFSGMTRGKHTVVRDRILKSSSVRVGIGVIQKIDLEFKRVSGEYPTISQLVKLGLVEARKREEEVEARNLRNKILEQDKSSVTRLAKDMNISLNFEGAEIREFVTRVQLIEKHILDERESDFFKSRYNLDSILEKNTVKRITLQEIGDKHDLSRERIRQVAKSSLMKIKSVYKSFPNGEIPQSYLTPIPETFKRHGKKKILTRMGKRFQDKEFYVVGQMEQAGLFTISFDSLVNHKLFKGIKTKVIVDYFSSHFPEILDKKSISYIYSAEHISVRSYNALTNAGIKSLDEIQIDQLEYIPNLGKKSITEIKNIYSIYFDEKSIPGLHFTNKLSVRSYNALTNAGIKSLDEIQIDKLEYIPNLGKKSITEIKNLVKEESNK